MNCFSCTVKEQFGNLQRFPERFRLMDGRPKGWVELMVVGTNRNFETQIEGFHQMSALLLGWKSRLSWFAQMLLTIMIVKTCCWPFYLLPLPKRHNNLSTQKRLPQLHSSCTTFRDVASSCCAQSVYIFVFFPVAAATLELSTWIILGFWESTSVRIAEVSLQCTVKESDGHCSSQRARQRRGQGGSRSLSRRPWWVNSPAQGRDGDARDKCSATLTH